MNSDIKDIDLIKYNIGKIVDFILNSMSSYLSHASIGSTNCNFIIFFQLDKQLIRINSNQFVVPQPLKKEKETK